ncbi:penicillin-binding protein 1A [Telluria aromaticivorans]|uniref:Penicillin-binding protein 1A n=1 Tax=Telluria aromaticivorans TaxID=2725995 RepID=A0A7Y2K372_9BURK|nr:PBP1A family penicillin-binding protein [Telluria aromaticivorans]NNG25493.1 PBP1A family penicillin-binding protein [Telluria aromaticivorans]
MLAALVLIIAGAAIYVMSAILPNVPSIDAVTDYRPKIPLRIYTADNVLIGEFGVEHREFVPIAKVPPLMKSALLAIEDTRFYEHGGIDWIRAAGAARSNLRGGFRQGASTITMQVARNFFLSREKLISRKLTEIALAYRIEDALTKEQILELYMNQIYLGNRSYGFSSAARSYFGKSLDDLSLAETAMLAGLPQNPSRHNPVVNPKRAQLRQHAVLKRLYELGDISEPDYRQALGEPLRLKRGGQAFDTKADYVAELARQAVFAQFGEAAYERGIVVTTTILKAEQDAAYESVRRNVLDYDQRHGYRGPEARIELPEDPEEREEAIVEALQKRPSSDGLVPAMVLAASSKAVRVETLAGDELTIEGAGLKFAARGLAPAAKESLAIAPGAVIRISKRGKDGWAITQVPQVAAAFVAIDADTGAYHALVGGFDYNLQKFNHVTQAWRQPGSAIKPFVYAAALDKGYSPGTRILDEQLDMPGENAGATWSPQNDDGVFSGPVTMRYSLAHSKNVTTVRLLRAVGVDYAHDYLGRFGFDLPRHARNMTLALGTGAVTPLQMAGAYAVFANGGYRVKPYLISQIRDGNGSIILENKPAAKQDGDRVLDARNAFILDSMLRDVTRYGTGAASVQKLGRTDIAGKTGTTSDAIDGWFAGYGGKVVAVAWMGYDEPRSLGGREFGATLALPIWIDYMRVALPKVPAQQEGEMRLEPEGVIRENDDWILAEFAERPDLHTIDIEPAPEDTAEPDELEPGEEPGNVPAPAAPVAPVASPPPPAPSPLF